MKKTLITLLSLTTLTAAPLLSISCQIKESVTRQIEQISSLHPKRSDSYVGDPMPFFNGEDFSIYYLDDARDSQIGYHPFNLMKTSDFYNYTDEDVVIPYVNEVNSVEKGIGTGTVFIDENGKYQAFYTGHNELLKPSERIMQATSDDGINFDKKGEVLLPSSNYSQTDFRDPFVFWVPEDKQYWMLVTTRYNNNGVIAKFVSNDLITWEDEGIFFENDLGTNSNLECPSLVYFDGKWWLAFSDQSPDRVVHYRVADDLKTEFRKPQSNIDFVDGKGLYAGRLETNGEQLFMVGWTPTKFNYDDANDYDWAGNLTVHESSVNNETLVPSLPKSAQENIKTILLDLLDNQTNWIWNNEQTVIYEYEYKDLSKKTRISFNGGKNHIIIDPNNSISYYGGVGFDALETSTPKSKINLSQTKDNNIKLVKDRDIFTIYFQDVAFTNRIYDSIHDDWEIYVGH